MSVIEQIFAEELITDFKSYITPEFANLEYRVIDNRKNNGVLVTGISVKKPGQEVSALIYVKPFYEAAKNGKSKNEIMKSFADTVEKALDVKGLPDVLHLNDYESVKENISVRLINTKENRTMLNGIPHKEIEDLSLVPIMCFTFPETDDKGSTFVNGSLWKSGVFRKKHCLCRRGKIWNGWTPRFFGA